MTERQSPMDATVQQDDPFAAAADWHTRLNDEDKSPLAHAEFEAWTAADPRNKAAFEAVERMWSKAGEGWTDPRIMDLRHEALTTVKRHPLQRFAAAAAIVGLLLGGAYLATPFLRATVVGGADGIAANETEGGAFRTALGERSTVTLSDGSSVVLNTNSRIDVRFTNKRRSVHLLAGQAWFQVSKDSQRPFTVEAGDQRVTALGTAFDVRMGKKNVVQVTLAEGRVSVEPIKSRLSALIGSRVTRQELLPGESLVTSGDSPASKQKADVLKVGSWRQGQIVFDNDTLEAAVAEVNRYSALQIELADPALANLRVSGVFKAGHSDSFIETVTGHYPIRITERAGLRVVLAAKSPDSH